MSKKSFRQAVNEALRQEMERDPTVVLMGEDVGGGMGAPGEDDAWGGPLGVTKGLMSQFGRERVLDTPITESAFIGAAAGAALPAPRGGIDVCGFHGRLLRPDFQSGGEVSLHVRRHGKNAVGDSHHVRRGLSGGKPAQPVPLSDFYPCAGIESGDPLFAL